MWTPWAFSTPRASAAPSRSTPAGIPARRRDAAAPVSGGSAALGEQLQKIAQRTAAKKDNDTAQKLAAALRADGEKLCNDCVLPAADRYMGFVYDTFATALDYLTPEAAVLIDQPARCAERAKEYTTQLREDVSLLVRSGTMAARAETFYEPFADMMRRIQEWAVVLADGLQLGRSPIEPRTMVSLTAKQLPSYGGSSQTAADDIAHYQNLGYRVVVLAGDLRRARILCEFLDGHGIHAAAAEHPDALPSRGSALSRRAASRPASSFRMPGSPSSRTRRSRRPVCGAQSIKSNPTARRSTPTPTSPWAISSCTSTTASAASRASCRCRSTVR